MILSDCCNSMAWLVAGKFKVNPEDHERLKLIPRGKTCFYMCDKCNEACDAHSNEKEESCTA